MSKKKRRLKLLKEELERSNNVEEECKWHKPAKQQSLLATQTKWQTNVAVGAAVGVAEAAATFSTTI